VDNDDGSIGIVYDIFISNYVDIFITLPRRKYANKNLRDAVVQTEPPPPREPIPSPTAVPSSAPASAAMIDPADMEHDELSDSPDESRSPSPPPISHRSTHQQPPPRPPTRPRHHHHQQHQQQQQQYPQHQTQPYIAPPATLRQTPPPSQNTYFGAQDMYRHTGQQRQQSYYSPSKHHTQSMTILISLVAD